MRVACDTPIVCAILGRIVLIFTDRTGQTMTNPNTAAVIRMTEAEIKRLKEAQSVICLAERVTDIIAVLKSVGMAVSYADISDYSPTPLSWSATVSRGGRSLVHVQAATRYAAVQEAADRAVMGWLPIVEYSLALALEAVTA